MALVPITLEKFEKKSFQRPETYAHAKEGLVVKVAAIEAPSLAENMPIGFSSVNGRFHLVGVQGISTRFQNLWVSPEGKWIGGYVPAFHRIYPFGLSVTDKGAKILCIREESPLIREDLQGLPFFGTKKEATEFLSEVLNFIVNIHAEIEHTDKICEELDRLDCLIPWEFEIKTKDEKGMAKGLFRIDGEQIDRLSGKNLETLRDIGALKLIYMHLFSLRNLRNLQKLQALNDNRGSELENLGTKIFDQHQEMGLNFDFEEKPS